MEELYIYVFSIEARNELLGLGYEILKNDEESNIFIFSNDVTSNFALGDINYVYSDIMTF